MNGLHGLYLDRALLASDVQQHLPEMRRTAACYPNCRVIELGVRDGNSTTAYLSAAEEVDGHVWSVDTGDCSGLFDTQRWTFLEGDSKDPRIVGLLPDLVDVVFIDTNHTYDQTIAELHAYVPKVKPGGTVLLHDTELNWPDKSYIPAGGYDVEFPVARALDAFCAETGLVWENRHGSYGLGVIAVP